MTSKNIRDMSLNEQKPASETRQGNTPNTHTPTTRARRHVLEECARRLQLNQSTWEVSPLLLPQQHLRLWQSVHPLHLPCLVLKSILLTNCWVSLPGAYSSAHGTSLLHFLPSFTMRIPLRDPVVNKLLGEKPSLSKWC